MQFQVPQFIETEDKIIGPLSIKEFMYLAAAGAISVLLYFTVQIWLWIFLSLILFAAAGALAFVKINGRPLIHVLTVALRFYWNPQTYVWQPENPNLPKNESSLGSYASGFSIESILQGLALKNTWKQLQTASHPQKQAPEKPTMEQYQFFRKISGEKRAARRVDYR